MKKKVAIVVVSLAAFYFIFIRTPVETLLMEGTKLYEKGDIDGAVPFFEKAAKKGNELGIYIMGNLYLTGKGVEKDETKAFEYFKKAAKNNFFEANFMIAKSYLEGIGVEKDLNEGVKWLQKAAEQDHRTAALMLGSIYLNGSEEIEKDLDEAFRLFEIVETRGDPSGLIIFSEHLIKNDKKEEKDKGLELLKSLSDKGYLAATISLANLFEQGLLVEQNCGEAIAYYKKSLLYIKNDELEKRIEELEKEGCQKPIENQDLSKKEDDDKKPKK